MSIPAPRCRPHVAVALAILSSARLRLRLSTVDFPSRVDPRWRMGGGSRGRRGKVGNVVECSVDESQCRSSGAVSFGPMLAARLSQARPTRVVVARIAPGWCTDGNLHFLKSHSSSCPTLALDPLDHPHGIPVGSPLHQRPESFQLLDLDPG